MKILIYAALIALLLVTACSPGGNTESAAVAALQATRSAQNAAATANAQAPTAEPPTAAPTEVPPTQALTETPTSIPTPTEIPTVKATTNSNANCRFGPDKVFPLVELLNTGTSALVIGQFITNGQWWKVRTDAGNECWVLGSNVSITGDVNTVAKLESPATPTPVPPPDWNGNWTIYMARDFDNKESAKVSFQVNMVQSGNQLSYSFALSPYSFNAYLTVSADGMSATGNLYRSDGNEWALRFYRVPGNLNQFQGEWYYKSNAGLDGDNCGSKGGAPKPNPCRP